MHHGTGRWRIVVVAAIVLACLIASYALYDDDQAKDLEGQAFIIHTNDSHGHYSENLGFSAVSALVEDYESRGATVFLMDAGDAFQGTATTMLSHGSTTVEVMNSAGYDVMVPGNHEFDYTLERYLGYTDQLDFPTVCSNLDWESSEESVFEEYVILEKNGVRLGVFGLATPDTPGSVFSGYLDSVTFTDPEESAREMVEILRGEDVDYIIALGHIGVDRSSSITSDEICSKVDGIDVFIDGHSHTAMEHGKVVGSDTELMESDTLIASTGSYISNIGVVALGDEPDSVLVSSYDGRDEDVDVVVDSIRKGQEDILSEVIGTCETYLDGERIPCRTSETGLGDFVCDSIRHVSGADIAVMNGGVFRASLHPGKITSGDIYAAIPFENYLVTKVVTGDIVLSMMEHSVSELPGAAGQYLQVSGMEVRYDSSRPAGDRVLSILVDGAPLDLDGSYTLATNDYIGLGGDGYDMLEDIPLLDQMGLIIDAQIDRIREIGVIGDMDGGRLVDSNGGDLPEYPNDHDYGLKSSGAIITHDR